MKTPRVQIHFTQPHFISSISTCTVHSSVIIAHNLALPLACIVVLTFALHCMPLVTERYSRRSKAKMSVSRAKQPLCVSCRPHPCHEPDFALSFSPVDRVTFSFLFRPNFLFRSLLTESLFSAFRAGSFRTSRSPPRAANPLPPRSSCSSHPHVAAEEVRDRWSLLAHW